MRILLTSDVHRDGKKLLWLLDEAPEHDTFLVAGDLLDIFSNTGFTEQISGALRWRETVLQSGKSFAWCSGNHDFFHGDHTPGCSFPAFDAGKAGLGLPRQTPAGIARACPYLRVKDSPLLVLTPFPAACIAGFPEGIDLLVNAGSKPGHPDVLSLQNPRRRGLAPMGH